MKHLAILLLFFFLSPVAQVQKKYIPDNDVESYRINETFIITQMSTNKALSRITNRELVTNVYHGLIGFKENNKFGMLSIYGKVVIPAIYDKPAEDDYSAFQLLGKTIGLTKEGKLTVLDTLGKTLVPIDKNQHQ